jgi:hypothetical protein
MSAVSATSSSIDAVNNLLKDVSTKAIDQAEKLVKVAVEMAVGKESGKGSNMDISV